MFSILTEKKYYPCSIRKGMIIVFKRNGKQFQNYEIKLFLIFTNNRLE
jgi:hypothetical protein